MKLLKLILIALILLCVAGVTYIAFEDNKPPPEEIDEALVALEKYQKRKGLNGEFLHIDSLEGGSVNNDENGGMLAFLKSNRRAQKPDYIIPEQQPLSIEPLNNNEIQLYKAIFKAQDRNDLPLAKTYISRLKDKRLLGHVLYQRYMHPEYRTSFNELKTWLNLYNDHPGAENIYRLAHSRKPKNYKGRIKSPIKAYGVRSINEPTMKIKKRYVSAKKRTNSDTRSLNTSNRIIYGFIRKGKNQSAHEYLVKNAHHFDIIEYDILRSEIASGFLYQGQIKTARKIAEAAAKRSGLNVPKAAWVAGLTAWQDERYKTAAKYFEMVARSNYASGWENAGGAYWAARSHMRNGNFKAVSTWLNRGMEQPRTFYGLISTRALGRDFDFNWRVPPFTEEHQKILSEIPSGNRAIALVSVGQYAGAQFELARIKPENKEQHIALMAYAAFANMPAIAMRLGTRSATPTGQFYDAALYPVGPWEPKDGFKISPALVNAIMRQESRFDPDAKSHAGAKGLMQLMPATAKSLAHKDETEFDQPETNMALGQRYLEDLLESKAVNGDLIYMLIAYNAGPGNLRKWKKRWPNVKDPLLFIELISASETRSYVEKVLANYWIYQMREGLETPTMDAIASGKPAIYDAEEKL